MKYVGKTKNPIRQRFNSHRNQIAAGTEGFVMLDHFGGVNGHGIASMKIKAIEICNKDNIDERERYWVKELNTVFPYGLNNDGKTPSLKNAFNVVIGNMSNICIYNHFNSKHSTRTKKGGRLAVNIESHNRSPDMFSDIDAYNWILDALRSATESLNFIHQFRTLLFELNKTNIKFIYLFYANMITQSEDLSFNSQYKYMAYIIKDLCLYRIKLTLPPTKPNKTAFLTIKYVNKLIDQIPFTKLLKSNSIKDFFPVKNSCFVEPGISFSRDGSIGAKVLNYRQTIADMDYATFECNCHSYPDRLVNEHHKHIVTGDLSIVRNLELRSILSKGLNFHDQKPPDREQVFNAVKSGLDKYIHEVSSKVKYHISQFTAWKAELLKLVRVFLNKSKSYSYNNVLSKPSVKEALKELHDDFVFVPIDKAANNVAIVCKSFYISIMTKEVESSSTFSKCNGSPNTILRNISQSVQCPRKHLRLPSLYCTVKMHKTPVSFRFITAGCDTVLQESSTAVGKCLKLLLNTCRSSNAYKIKYIDNNIFIIDNRDKVLQCINKSNISGQKGRKYLSTWDFTTLYTKIPHNILIGKMSWFVDKAFGCLAKFRDPKSFVCFSSSSDSAYYSKNRSKKNISFDAAELIAAIQYIVEHSHIIYHGTVFHQRVGIPMGTNSAPYLANIYLHTFEYCYLEKLIREGKIDIAKLLSNTYRYQDDCIAINDKAIFKKHFELMYNGSAMELKNTNLSRDKCNFLDLTISIYQGKFIYRSYDKRNDFNFNVVNYPNLSGNIPVSQSYGVFTSQLVRYCSINSSFKNFVSDVRQLTYTLYNQNFQHNGLVSRYGRFCCKYLYTWAKYNKDIQTPKYMDKIFKTFL